MTEQEKQQIEDMEKSLDIMIDDLFADEDEVIVEKSMIKDMKPQNETADQAVNAAPSAQKDEARNAGRPKQISDVPQKDEDGRRQSEYDDSISEENKDGKTKEQDQVKAPAELVKKSEVSISEAEFAEYQAFKKSQAENQKAEELKKAEERQSDLLKSIVEKAISPVKEENEMLKKALSEQTDLIKSIANKPQSRKAVTNVQAVERFEKSESNKPQASIQDVLDVAEEMVKSKELTTEHVIELEQSGYIFEDGPRQALERRLARR